MAQEKKRKGKEKDLKPIKACYERCKLLAYSRALIATVVNFVSLEKKRNCAKLSDYQYAISTQQNKTANIRLVLNSHFFPSLPSVSPVHNSIASS